MSLAALRELRKLFPKSNITVAAPPGTADIFLETNFIDDVLVQRRSGFLQLFRNAREWRRRNFDLGLLFQNAFSAAALAFLARVPVRIGYHAERRDVLLTTPVRVPVWKNQRHESFYYLNLVAELERLMFGTAIVVCSNEPKAYGG